MAVPTGVVTVMVTAPVTVLSGVVKVIWVGELTTKLALTPLTFTREAPEKFVPVMTVVVPPATSPVAPDETDPNVGALSHIA